MKILYCHNHYREPGGEDKVADAEEALLASAGHEVVRYRRHNDDTREMGRAELLHATIWNRRTFEDVTALIRKHRPDILHCANIFPLISPSIYAAARSLNVPVVQTLHNYRLICPNALLLRDGKICELCVGKQVAWPAVRYRCYRQSRGASAAVAAMLAVHGWRGSWARDVDRFIALTGFARRKLVEGGLPGDKIVVKPNFLAKDPGIGAGQGNYAVYVGRLSHEKGIETLLEAWRGLSGDLGLKIIGDGPLAPSVRQAADSDGRIEWLGHLEAERVLSLVGDARFLVMPSIWYETFGLTMIEAFAKGTPVIVSEHGSMAEIVEDGRTGWSFEPASAADLAEKVNKAAVHPDAIALMRKHARQEFERKYTAKTNYRQLIGIYEAVLADQRQPATTEFD